MTDLTKSQKRAVRELLGEAHEAEIAAALLDVESAIQEWRRGEILPSDVSERIHRFHQKNQEIFKQYNYLQPILALARAAAFGFIAAEQVPESLRPQVNELKTLVG